MKNSLHYIKFYEQFATKHYKFYEKVLYKTCFMKNIYQHIIQIINKP